MPVLGVRCHELRIRDENKQWRIIYRIDPDAIVIVGVFVKKSAKSPARALAVCRRRLADYDWLTKD